MSATRFTEGARAGLVARLEAGVPLSDAARAEGLPVDTVRSWLRRGRGEGAGEYADFAAGVERARAKARSARRPVPSEHDVLVLLSEAARNGSVSAMKELRAYHRERGAAPSSERHDSVDALDELAARREAVRRGRGG